MEPAGRDPAAGGGPAGHPVFLDTIFPYKIVVVVVLFNHSGTIRGNKWILGPF